MLLFPPFSKIKNLIMSTLTALYSLLGPASASDHHHWTGIGNFTTPSSCNCHCSYGNKCDETLPGCGKKKEERKASPTQLETSSYSPKEHYEFSTWQPKPHANANGGHLNVWRSGTSCAAAVVLVKSPELHSFKKKIKKRRDIQIDQNMRITLMGTVCCRGDLRVS